MNLLLHKQESPLGTLLLVHDNQSLRALDFADYESRLHRLLTRHYGSYTLIEGSAPAAITQALQAYFNGNSTALGTVPTATAGTPFQRAVWAALRTIPAGETRTYGQIAAQLGAPKAVRAVGAANGLNPIAIVVPCHRVIGASGKLTGYAGSLPRKQWLLNHESTSLLK